MPCVHRFPRRAPWVRLAIFALVAVGAPLPAAVRADSQPLAHFRISTHVAAAQREFDFGLSSIYAFAPEDALAHFQAAGRLDPACAMAFYGIALGAGPNVNIPYDLSRAAIGRAAVAEAAKRAVKATPAERDLIAALAKRYDVAHASQIDRAQRMYARAMDSVAKRYPIDPTVATLAAESFMDLRPLHYWRRDGSPEPDTLRAISLLDAALVRERDHVGANHYLIHLYERSATPARALESARRLAERQLEPIDEHLAHMPAHIFLRLGLVDEAVAAGERSVALFRRLITVPHAVEHDGYFHHDLQVLAASYAMAGRWEPSRRTADEIAAQVDDSEAAVETYARFHRWRDILALAAPARPGVRWHFVRGLAQSETGDRNGAAAESRALGTASGSDVRLTIARDVLDASIAHRARDGSRAIALLEAAVAAQDSLERSEPPKWYAPVRESLGARYFEDRRFADARRTFAADLARNPGNPRSLFGLARTLAALHDRGADAADAAFRRSWRRSDTRLAISEL